jgi:hypothetical protein
MRTILFTTRPSAVSVTAMIWSGQIDVLQLARKSTESTATIEKLTEDRLTALDKKMNLSKRDWNLWREGLRLSSEPHVA